MPSYHFQRPGELVSKLIFSLGSLSWLATSKRRPLPLPPPWREDFYPPLADPTLHPVSYTNTYYKPFHIVGSVRVLCCIPCCVRRRGRWRRRARRRTARCAACGNETNPCDAVNMYTFPHSSRGSYLFHAQLMITLTRLLMSPALLLWESFASCSWTDCLVTTFSGPVDWFQNSFFHSAL